MGLRGGAGTLLPNTKYLEQAQIKLEETVTVQSALMDLGKFLRTVIKKKKKYRQFKKKATEWVFWSLVDLKSYL